MLELQNRAGREQRVQGRGLESDRGEGNPCLDAALKLQEFNLEVGGGREVRILFLEPAQLGNLARFRSDGSLWFGHAGILAELD